MITRKVFVEPAVVKYEQSLDKVTLNGGGSCGGGGSSDHDEKTTFLR